MRKETLAKMSTIKLDHISSLLLLFLFVLGLTIGGQAWADKFEGTEGPDIIIGTPEEDEIDSKGGEDKNTGDSQFGNGYGDDRIDSGEGDDNNFGDNEIREGYRCWNALGDHIYEGRERSILSLGKNFHHFL